MDNNQQDQTNTETTKQNESGEKTLRWKLLGLFAPPVGLAFYFQMKRERPKEAQALFFGMLISISVLFVGVFILGIVLGANAS